MTQRIIDWLFSKWEKDHCRLAYEADIQRAKDLIKTSKNALSR